MEKVVPMARFYEMIQVRAGVEHPISLIANWQKRPLWSALRNACATRSSTRPLSGPLSSISQGQQTALNDQTSQREMWRQMRSPLLSIARI